uniref:Uncharacterized protein n=1 Tax=Rhizophora mucronata TaxID=61149 RepID=A0A2P2PDQ9_RHIMU
MSCFQCHYSTLDCLPGSTYRQCLCLIGI